MNETTIHEQMRIAAGLRQARRLPEARRIYESVIAANPMHAQGLFHLSATLAAEGRLDEAIGYIRRALTVEPQQPVFHYELGNYLGSKGAMAQAIAAYRRAIELKYEFPQAHNQLGLAHQRNGEHDLAERHFREAVRFDPKYAKGLNNLGNILKGKKELDEAIACFEAAIKSQPNYFPAYVNLGEAQQLQGRVAEAAENFAKAIQLKPDEFHPYVKLGMALVVETRLEEAEVIMRRALALKPDDIGALVNLAYALKEQGKFDEAIATYEKASQLDEGLLVSAVGAYLSLPPIYQSEEEIAAVRRQYEEGLERLRKNVDLYKQRPAQAMTLIWGNFLLAYQGLNDRELQRRYGEFLTELLRHDAPEFFEPMPLKIEPKGRRIRVGIMSSLLRSCTVGSYFKSWITELDRSRIELFVYFTGHSPDMVTKEISEACDHFAHLVGLTPGIARRVQNDKLDVLVYPEIGMDAGICTRAALRLAPVQVAAWGHPTTTGYPNIDYYLSSALMEPPNAAEHYTEKLVLLSGLGTCYRQPGIPDAGSRKDFELPEDRTLYLCPQSLFKIHPSNDELLVSILEQDPRATLVLFQGMFAETTNVFMRRLERIFDERKLSKVGRVKILPRLGHAEYLQVNRLCDVMLDTLYWSGGNTSLDALACGLPIVTLPGEMMRGRQSFGMLTAMNLHELVAHDREEYLAIALRLGQDHEWREQIRQRIKDSVHLIFGRTEPIRDLERFLLSVASNS